VTLSSKNGDILTGGWFVHVIFLVVSGIKEKFDLLSAERVPVFLTFSSEGTAPGPPEFRPLACSCKNDEN